MSLFLTTVINSTKKHIFKENPTFFLHGFVLNADLPEEFKKEGVHFVAWTPLSSLLGQLSFRSYSLFLSSVCKS